MSKRTPTVYAFMDESGDPGKDIQRGASSHFVLALVETNEPEKLREELRRLRVTLNLPIDFEFRFHDTRSITRRAAFFVLLRSLDIRVRVAVIDKRQLPRDFESFGPKLYQFALGRLILRAAPSALENAVLIMDGEHGRTTETVLGALRQYLTQLCAAHERARPFKKLIARTSEKEDGLQYADMVAGALAEHITRGESPYADYVANKLVDLWIYPQE